MHLQPGSRSEGLSASERAAAVGLIATWVGHDIAQPLHALAIVLDNLEAALGSDADADLQEKVQLCQDQISLAADFLALLRGVTARNGQAAVPNDLARALDRALRLLAPRFALADVIIRRTGPEEAAMVRIPADDLLLLLTQVLGLAARMVGKGEVLSIRCDRDGNDGAADRVRLTLSWCDAGAEPDRFALDLARRLAEAGGGGMELAADAAACRLSLALPADVHDQ